MHYNTSRFHWPFRLRVEEEIKWNASDKIYKHSQIFPLVKIVFAAHCADEANLYNCEHFLSRFVIHATNRHGQFEPTRLLEGKKRGRLILRYFSLHTHTHLNPPSLLYFFENCFVRQKSPSDTMSDRFWPDCSARKCIFPVWKHVTWFNASLR